MKVFSQLTVAALASYATAASVDVFKRETPLKVELSAAGNSQVKVVVTNNGDKALNLLSKGTFLDEENPIEKVTMYANKGSKSSISSRAPSDASVPVRKQEPVYPHKFSCELLIF